MTFRSLTFALTDGPRQLLVHLAVVGRRRAVLRLDVPDRQVDEVDVHPAVARALEQRVARLHGVLDRRLDVDAVPDLGLRPPGGDRGLLLLESLLGLVGPVLLVLAPPVHDKVLPVLVVELRDVGHVPLVALLEPYLDDAVHDLPAGEATLPRLDPVAVDLVGEVVVPLLGRLDGAPAVRAAAVALGEGPASLALPLVVERELLPLLDVAEGEDARAGNALDLPPVHDAVRIAAGTITTFCTSNQARPSYIPTTECKIA
ncbi:hypothetical protein THAOC_22754 [Thalassiosira oceanica]|uniref:Uncharacterized protein n=1 Tax=Thalassiosira oceanica TaxID=159749 RepID=K0S8N9_THAOC|nr:hypothetical protein THAOC_22754 [Thalassiosira oceanica]|eukprot:EJK57231.1 hypothetical protein THAOC_22754 [Thalassiosira oceanica]